MFTTSKFSFLTYIFFPCRYEWEHRGSTHIHGFIWLENAPIVDNLDWEDAPAVAATKTYFDNFLTAWNPCPLHLWTPAFH